MIPIITPDVSFEEVAADLRRILDSGRLTQGEYVARFEDAVARQVGVPHAVATTSATTALHLALIASGVGAGDEVIVSDFSFPATGNVVVQLGARPVFVDCAPDRFDADLVGVRRALTDRTRALLVVDPFGQPAALPGLEQIARRAGVALIEDAACALGAAVDGRPCGSFGSFGCFSFHPRKLVTTGEGGAVTTFGSELAEHLRLLRAHGGAPSGGVGLSFVVNGFNYRLSELPAAMGLPQLARLDAILADRRRTAGRYEELLEDVTGVEVRRPRDGEAWTYQSFVVMLDEAIDRDDVVRGLARAGVESTLGTYAMHAHPAFARFGYSAGDLPNSYRSQRQSLTLPLLPRMDNATIDLVVASLAKAIA